MSSPSSQKLKHRGNVASLVVFSLVAISLVGAGIYFYLSQGDNNVAINPILTEVSSGEFVSQVLDQGEVQSSENVEIRCEARARNGSISVIEVIPEGTLVKGGDFLVQLDSSAFDKELEQQLISVTNAQTSLIQAKADVEVAEESKNEYVQGLFKQALQTIENEVYDAESAITTAEQELNQAKVVVDHSRKLLNKGFITKQSMETDEFEVKKREIALEKANNQLDLANNKKLILETITKKKELIQLNSNIEAAKVKYGNAQENLKIEQLAEAEIKDMIAKCTIKVPPGIEGQVVYAKESSRGGNDWMLEEGTSVRERQVLIRLPNPEKMEVKALINEQSITQISPGMPATIKVDALNNVTLKGIVTKVNQYAESGGWMSSTVRKYAVNVKIINPPEALKPGMNAAVTIQVRFEPDAMMAPIQTVYAVGSQKFCMIKNGDQWETREVEIEADNSQMVLIKSGLELGEQLVMNPGAYKDYMTLPEAITDSRIELSADAQMESEQIAANQTKRPRAMPQDDGPGESGNAEDSNNGPRGERGRGGEGRGGQGGGRQGGGGPGGGSFDIGSIVQRSMDRYDTNSDGKIDADEMGAIEGRGAEMVGQADGNGDGIVTKEEMTTAMEAMMQRAGGAGGGRPGGSE